MSVPVAGGRDEGLPVGKPLVAGRPAEESKNAPQAEAERPLVSTPAATYPLATRLPVRSH